MTSVKWLSSIVAVTEPFRGFHQAIAYRNQRSEADPGEPVTRIRPRALMIPPGFPDFPERRRYVDRGPVTIQGRAWSGAAPIVRVEVGIDGTWFEADLAEPAGDWAWRGWSYQWEATRGEYVLSCRATDATGDTQPVEQPWLPFRTSGGSYPSPIGCGPGRVRGCWCRRWWARRGGPGVAPVAV